MAARAGASPELTGQAKGQQLICGRVISQPPNPRCRPVRPRMRRTASRVPASPIVSRKAQQRQRSGGVANGSAARRKASAVARLPEERRNWMEPARTVRRTMPERDRVLELARKAA